MIRYCSSNNAEVACSFSRRISKVSYRRYFVSNLFTPKRVNLWGKDASATRITASGKYVPRSVSSIRLPHVVPCHLSNSSREYPEVNILTDDHYGRRETQCDCQPTEPKQKRALHNVGDEKHQPPPFQSLIVLHRTQKNPDDVVITLAIRTPLAKGFKGAFKDTQLDYLVYSLLKKVIQKSNIDPQMVEDICLGNVRF